MITSPSVNARMGLVASAQVTSSLDVCLLYDWQTGPDFDRCCDMLLHHLCDSPRAITRATRRPSHLDLHFETTRLLIESYNPAQIAQPLRPACSGPDRSWRDLRDAHARSDAAIRLRVAAGFDQQRLCDLLTQLTTLVNPTALILMDSHIVLTHAEFSAASFDQLGLIAPGQALIRRRRPAARRPSIFDTSPRSAMAASRRTMPATASRADTLCAVLADDFRKAPRWSWICSTRPGQRSIAVLSSRDGALHLDPTHAAPGTLRIRFTTSPAQRKLVSA